MAADFYLLFALYLAINSDRTVGFEKPHLDSHKANCSSFVLIPAPCKWREFSIPGENSVSTSSSVLSAQDFVRLVPLLP